MSAPESRVPEKRHSMADKLIRIRAIEHAGELIGQARLAEAMRMPVRTLRSYATAERRLPDEALVGAATALEAYAADVQAHASKLRALAEGRVCAGSRCNCAECRALDRTYPGEGWQMRLPIRDAKAKSQAAE